MSTLFSRVTRRTAGDANAFPRVDALEALLDGVLLAVDGAAAAAAWSPALASAADDDLAPSSDLSAIASMEHMMLPVGTTSPALNISSWMMPSNGDEMSTVACPVVHTRAHSRHTFTKQSAATPHKTVR